MKKLLLSLIIFTVMLATAVTAQDAINIAESSIALTGNIQETLTGTFNLQNTGTTTISTSFSGLTLTSGSRTIVINPITSLSNIAPAAQQPVTFTLATGNSFAGTYSGTITATVTTNTAVTDTLPISVTINPTPALASTNPSITVSKGGSKSSTFTLTNTGNTDLTGITLTMGSIASGSNIIPASAISLSKSSANVNFGASDTITVTVNPSTTQAAGSYSGPITINFGSGQVTATLAVIVRDPIHNIAFKNVPIKVGSPTTDRNTSQSVSFVIENVGDFSEIVDISLANVNSRYNAQVSIPQTTLAAGSSQTITLTLSIPNSQDSGIVNIGQVVLTFSGTTATETISVETESQLSIDDVDVTVGGNTDSNLQDGNRIDDEAKPEDRVKFDIQIKNLFSDNDDIQIENIEVEITIQDIDDGDDLEKTSSDFDLNADKKKTVSIDFEVPLEVESGNYDVIIIADGRDENGARHTDRMQLELEVDRENDDVRITKADLSSSTIKCGQSTSLRFEIRNLGDSTQDDAAVVISNTDLGLNQRFDDIELDDNPTDRDSRFSRSVDIVVPSSASPGSYPIDVIAFIDRNTRIDREVVTLNVQSCEEQVEQTTTDTNQPDRVLVNVTGQQASLGVPAAIAGSIEVPLTQSPVFLALLVLANLVVLGGIIFLVFKYLV
jgi:uncharacterized membrane protein